MIYKNLAVKELFASKYSKAISRGRGEGGIEAWLKTLEAEKELRLSSPKKEWIENYLQLSTEEEE